MHRQEVDFFKESLLMCVHCRRTHTQALTHLQELRLTFRSAGIGTVARAQLMRGSVNVGICICVS